MVSAYAIVTLVLFVLSIFCIIRPVPIPTPWFLPKISLNLTTAPIITILILWSAQCLNPTVIRNGIVGTEGIKPYNIIILSFSLAYMAITLDISGVLRVGAYWVSKRGGNNGWKFYLYFYVLLTVISILPGRDLVILSGTAFLVNYTRVAGLDPIPWVMAEFAAMNTASMVLFVGNPTNVVICEGFGVNNAAFTAYTILPFVACNIFCFVALAFQFRNQIPRKLARTIHRDPWKALRDPVAACVGCFMLGTTLVLCLVVSFFRIDVWMISLPFAVCKFVFDLGWDSYRISCNIPIGLPEAEEEAGKESDGALVPKTLERSRPASPINPEIQSNSGPLSESTVVDSGPGTSKVVLETFPAEGPGGTQMQSRSHDFEVTVPVEHADPALSAHPQVQTGSNDPLEPAIDCRIEMQKMGPDPDDSPIRDDAGEAQIPSGEVDSHGVDHETTLISSTAIHTPPATDTNLSPVHSCMKDLHTWLFKHFPTAMTAFPRLPFGLVLFAFSQFILIEALDHQGWVNVFGDWLVRASNKQVYPTIWLIGVLGVILCNILGTNLGATILLTQVVRAAALPHHANRAAAIALAIASNIGAMSFTFSASLVGPQWRSILEQKGIHMKWRTFVFWNLLPIFVLTSVGLGVVSAEMAVLFSS